MKKQFDWEIRTIDGEPVKDGTEKALTAKSVAVNALLSQVEEEKGLTGEDKANRYKLAMSIHGTKEGESVNLKSEEIALIKKTVGQIYLPLVVGQMFNFLDSDQKPTETLKEQ